MSETADTIVVRLLAETERAQRDVRAYGRSVGRSMTAVEVAVSRAGDSTARSTDRQREAYRQLGTSLVSVAADAIEGKNAFQILGEQGTTVAASLAGFGGAVGRVAGFLSGPWGAAITTAISLAGMFATRSDESALAARGEGEAARNLGEAIEDLDTISGAHLVTPEQARAAARRSVESYLAENRAARQAAGGVLVLAKANLAEAEARAVDPTLAGEGGFNGGIVAASGYAGQAARAEAKIAALDEEWVKGLSALRRSRSDEIIEEIEGELDPVLGAERRLAAEIESLRDRHQVYLLGDEEFRARARALMRRRPTSAGAVVARPGAPAERRELTPAERRAGMDDTLADIEDKDAAIDIKLLPHLLEEALLAEVREALAGLPMIDAASAQTIDVNQIERMAKISAGLADDLSKTLADALISGKSLGDVLVDSFGRAGAALLQSQIMRLLDPNGDGSAGFVKTIGRVFGQLVGVDPPGRASGGHVSAGRLYRINEAGIEGFRPAGSGSIIPLGRMARPQGGGITVVQPMNVSFAGAITTPELMAQFKAYADGVGQAAVMGGAAMAQAQIAKRAARALPR